MLRFSKRRNERSDVVAGGIWEVDVGEGGPEDEEEDSVNGGVGGRLTTLFSFAAAETAATLLVLCCCSLDGLSERDCSDREGG